MFCTRFRILGELGDSGCLGCFTVFSVFSGYRGRAEGEVAQVVFALPKALQFCKLINYKHSNG